MPTMKNQKNHACLHKFFWLQLPPPPPGMPLAPTSPIPKIPAVVGAQGLLPPQTTSLAHSAQAARNATCVSAPNPKPFSLQ